MNIKRWIAALFCKYVWKPYDEDWVDCYERGREEIILGCIMTVVVFLVAITGIVWMLCLLLGDDTC